MNGEPRETAPTEVAKTRLHDTDAEQANRPLPPVLNTQAVVMTRVEAETDLAPLFESGAEADFRARWDLVQRSFVDDPRKAVEAADELVAQVTRTLTDSFAHQRSDLEKSFDQAESPSTEGLRIALRQYRAFFERLLSL
jgi:hypothetical protein